ncbi:MAG: nuclear transport factor 2 family protein [Pyrinomonadaceae bacterium]|nr:nuclear transport factor 2 family protein [Pyrinomonadaceae bacterium]
MKNFLLVILSLLAFVGSTAPTGHAQDKQCKFMAKGGRVQMSDKSKSCIFVLRELEAVFAERVKAVKNRDAEAQVAQVSPDYSATLPNGQTLNYEQIVGYIRQGPQQIISVLDLSITIESLTVRGNEAIVDARQQNYSRTQRLRDGNIHNVVTGVLQRETWVRTAEGWKLKRVDNLREQKFLVDGKPFNPGTP